MGLNNNKLNSFVLCGAAKPLLKLLYTLYIVETCLEVIDKNPLKIVKEYYYKSMLCLDLTEDRVTRGLASEILNYCEPQIGECGIKKQELVNKLEQLKGVLLKQIT
jgi:hypothetical protein